MKPLAKSLWSCIQEFVHSWKLNREQEELGCFVGFLTYKLEFKKKTLIPPA